MASSQPPSRDGRAAFVLAAFLAINPAIVFLLTRSVVLAVVLPLCAALILFASVRRYGSRLPTVYATNIIALIGLSCYAEVVFTTAFPDYVIDELYTLRRGYYFNRPNLTSRLESKEFSVDYLTNNDGFRIGRSQQTGVSFDSVDWLFIGDSFTQAAQVNFDDMFTSLLYRTSPDRIIANVGVSGFGLPEELALYKDLGRRLRPKTVFLQLSAFNDFVNVREHRMSAAAFLSNHSAFARFLLQNLTYKNPAALPLGRWTEPFHPTQQENTDFNVFYKHSSENKDTDLRAFAEYLRAFAEAVASDGARLVIVLLPTKEQISYRYLKEVVDAFGLDVSLLDFERPARLVRSVAAPLGLSVLDLSLEFGRAEEDPFLVYDEHMSPAGHRILANAIAAHVGEVMRTRPEVLSAEYAGDRYPSPTRDGRIVYQSLAGGSMELFVTDQSFASIRQLTVDDVSQSHPVMSSDGLRLAFTEGDQERGDTHVILSDSSAALREQVTAGSMQFGAIPDFSPDGSLLAYAGWSRQPGSVALPRIVVRDLRTGASRFVTPEGSETWRPVFSPDGEHIVYIMRVDGQFDLFVTDLQSPGATRRLTSTPYDEWDPRFSPTGDHVVYSARKNGNWDLFLLKSDSTQQLTQTLGDEWDPSFSSDGKSLLYAGEFGIYRGIYRMKLPF